MGGGLGYVDLDEGVKTTLENLEDFLSNYFGGEDINWQVAFGHYGIIAVENPSSDLVDIPVVARLTEKIPEEYANSSGEIPSPIFPVGGFGPRENLEPEETEGYEQSLIRGVAELRPLEKIEIQPDDVFEEIIRLHQDRGIVDAFGTVWSERDSLLAAKAAEHSLSVDNPDVVVSFDILQTLAFAFQHEDFLKFDKNEEGEIVRSDEVGFDKIILAEPLSLDDLPEVEKVYVHQDKRVAASDHEISSNQITSELRGRVLGVRNPCTIPDPNGRGRRAQIGSVAKVVLDEDQETYNGFFQVSPEADVSFLYDFYAALKVPEAPFLTSELAQETSDWYSETENFVGWSVAEDGFAFKSIDGRRDIPRELYAHKYWVIRGEKYRKKSEFEQDVEALIQQIESNLEYDASWREFQGDRIKKTPILQEDVLDQMKEEVRAPPSERELLEAAGGIVRNSEEVEGINEPLFPSDLSEFVADTSIIDAEIISQLVSEGDLYGSTVLVPSVVLEEIHRQVEQETSRGKSGLEELTALRELSEKGILTLEVVQTEGHVDTEDNVAVDQVLINIAQDRGIPVCSADETLLKFAEAAGVTAFPLKQELSRWGRLIKNSLRRSEGLSVSELIRDVYLQVEESKVSEAAVQRALFRTPGQSPRQDLATEMAIRDEIEQLQRRGEIYKQGNQVGLKKTVAVVPSLEAVEKGIISEWIKDGSLAEKVDLTPHEIRIELLFPANFEYWASLQPSQKYLTELHALEDLEHANEIQIEWRDVLPSETGLAFADEDQFSNLMQGVQRKAATEFEHTKAIDTSSGSIMLNY